MITKIQEVFNLWLRGTTCGHKRAGIKSIFWQEGRLVLFKHKGHSEYCGRWTGNQWCGTYYVLYDVLDIDDNYWTGGGHLLKIEGRLPKNWRELIQKAIDKRMEERS